MTSEVLFHSCLSVLGGILAFLVIYHTAIFAMMLTGKIITGILATFVLSFYGTIVCDLTIGLTKYFFDTCSNNASSLADTFAGYVSPSALFSHLLTSTSSSEGTENTLQSWTGVLVRHFSFGDGDQNLPLLFAMTLIFLIVLWLLSVLLYQKRGSEAAGNALAFAQTAPFIKILISIPTALYIGLITCYLFGSGKSWMALISILSVILLCGIIEFIYHMDLRRLLAGKYSSLIAVFGVIGILCILHFDLFGYDSWLPKADSLESMSFYTDNFSSYFSYPSVNGYASYKNFMEEEACQITDFAPLYELAQEGISNAESGITPDAVYDEDSSCEYLVLSVRFNKKHGKTAYRCYAVRKDHMLDALTALCRDENYRKTLFPAFYLDYDDITGIDLLDIYDQVIPLDLTQEQQDALLDAYKQDVLAADIEDLQKKSPLGELNVRMPDSSVTSDSGYQNNNSLYSLAIPQFYLYDSYENSLNLLREYGYVLRTEIDPADVTSMVRIETVTENVTDQDGTVISDYLTSNEYPVTDAEEIADTLAQIRYSCTGILGGGNITSRSVELQLKGDPDIHYYPLP